jgi:transcriptional regulator with XRE-family HTH domain
MTHPLALYLEDTGDTLADFARRIGSEVAALENLLEDGEASPSLARRIAAATDGAISFEQLMSGRGAVIADLTARRTVETALDLQRLAEAFAAAAAAISRKAARIPASEFEIAAEATAHTYAALAPITSATGRDRLVQALRPVLREMLEHHGVPPGDPAGLDAAASAAVRRYHGS